ncbi:MAG: hypothetical protein KAX49_14960 [Halanaerobiales bacterium]|nr:hypothetical protein [Halanaerobiales bacterium]
MFQFNDQIKFSEIKEIDLTAVGEILIDMISTEYSDTLNCSQFNRYFGGSPGNIVMNIKKLGGNPAIVTKVGKDDFGEFLVDTLKENGVNTEGVQFDEHSNTSMVVVNKSKTTPKFIAYRDPTKR